MTDPTFHETMLLDDGNEVTVKFTQGPYYPAVVSGPADNWCPAEGGEIDILDIFGEDSVSVVVSDATRQRFYDELYRLPPHEHEPDSDAINDERREARDMPSAYDWDD